MARVPLKGQIKPLGLAKVPSSPCVKEPEMRMASSIATFATDATHAESARKLVKATIRKRRSIAVKESAGLQTGETLLINTHLQV
jgi:hypothetical protein